jgi:mannose-6-phosphate isomerase-like protein (cupin superfamily)
MVYCLFWNNMKRPAARFARAGPDKGGKMSQWVYNGWEFPAAKAEPPRERFLKIISSPETTGYEKASILFSLIPPGSSSGMHTHPKSDEIMYCVGRGEIIIDGETVPLETDSVIMAPIGVQHELRNTSETETLKLFCVYIPPIELNELLTGLAEKTKDYLKDK